MMMMMRETSADASCKSILRLYYELGEYEIEMMWLCLHKKEKKCGGENFDGPKDPKSAKCQKNGQKHEVPARVRVELEKC
jgi:hypothetical protein